jgi:2-dehydropantoate 2-reductase
VNLAVVGCGAMGGSLAAEASAAGYSVAVVDVVPELVQEARARGLTVEQDGQALTAPVEATTDAGEVGPVDCVVVFVKSEHTPAAAAAVGPLLGPATAVVTLQNGWGNADVLARSLPEERLVLGVTYNSCTTLGLARFAHTGVGRTFIGPYVDGGSTAPAEIAARMLGDAGWANDVTPAVRTEIWRKLVLTSATLPTAALTGLAAGRLGEPGPMLELVDALAAETVAVGQALGLDVDLDERLERIHATLEGAGKGKASMLQDVEARRKTEVEVVNGAVARLAAEHGVAAPLNAAMDALIGGVERSWTA